jgi:hypothetical protein
MGATPIAGHRHDGEQMPQQWRNDTPVAALHRERAAWGYLVRPSLMPTVFAPSGSAAGSGTSEEVAARRV